MTPTANDQPQAAASPEAKGGSSAPTGSALVRCRMCGWHGTLDQSEEAGTDCPACPQCGAEKIKLGGPAIVADERK